MAYKQADDLEIRELKEADIKEAMGLVRQVFNRFVAPEYSQEGIDEFQKFVEPETVIRNMGAGVLKLWGCFDDGCIAGVIAMKSFAVDLLRGPYWSGSHIDMLFVKEEYHRQGIAKRLLETAKQACFEAREITVYSSPYAVGIYKRLGFAPTGGEMTVNGIRFTPMKCKK